MAVQECVQYDALGRCVRTGINVMRDPPPGSGLSPYDGRPIPGYHAGFDSWHFDVWILVVAVFTFLTFRALRWALGTLDTPGGTVAMIPGFAFAVFASMVFANLALDHHFHMASIGASIIDAAHDVRNGWNWLRGFRS